ncbi:esterase-like activity of phytase family protein [Novosphingobium album (ex Liu et al. 2023)]|uniref:Esterase-like activity of phytase family protein n=1 Tax=Novosphingobium album (ex Liu et al. 2023) TaxID=3031130 RepID=A0ABT5WNU1_9SPHN|nr:esterase-like activity of phytase family protein [Novosphingobium album (ex Liu et al. 2023)]MDE8651712.1 esterase-like activity of phytase family protein [Novosphingobium album (ex Liu et al. 2023)]
MTTRRGWPSPLRLAALALLAVGLAPGILWRDRPRHRVIEREVHVIPLVVPAPAVQRPHLGAFRLAGVWRLSNSRRQFGGYSAMLALPDGRLMMIADGGFGLIIAPPDGPGARPEWFRPKDARRNTRGFHDFESATADFAHQRIWLAEEGINTIFRMGADRRLSARIAPPTMRDWGINSGAEAMVRLHDGRFVLLREAAKGWFERRRHAALLFPGDPIAHPRARRFTFEGPAQFAPTDMAQMPDGRVLILMRRLVWPMPARFAGRIVIADPRTIREGGIWPSRVVARLSSSLPIDNFEAMAIRSQADGTLAVWLVSDDNHGVFQRTLLWKLVVDPARLP